MKTIPALALTSNVQRPTSPVKTKKQSRRTVPVLTSSPVAIQPEPMMIDPTDPVDLNIAISDASSTLEPDFDEMYHDKKLTKAKLDMYNIKKLFKHYDVFPDCRFVQAQRKPRPDSDNIDLPTYFVKFAGEPCYTVLKGPHSRHHCEKWWNFMDRAAATSTPEDLPYLLGEKRKLYKFVEDGAVIRNAPTRLQHPP